MMTLLDSHVQFGNTTRYCARDMQFKAFLKSRWNLANREATETFSKLADRNGVAVGGSFATGGDFWLVMVLLILGWGLWTGKEVRQLTVQTENAVVTPVTMSECEQPFEAFGNLPTSEEALKWINLLQSFDDEQLSSVELLKKYENLSMASAILSASSPGNIRQQFWSAQAVEHSERALSILSESATMLPADKLDEANTRLLMAMSLNFLQNGTVNSEEVLNQYHNIDQKYLRSHGFLRNKLLRALAQREIIELPNYFSDINI